MLLEIKNLSIDIPALPGHPNIVSHVDLGIAEERIVALVGGSGSGKTTTGLSILRLLSEDLRIVAGKMFFKGKNILDLSSGDLRQFRGKEVGMVFQEPLNAFNPVFTIGRQIEEVLCCHTNLSRQQRKSKILELLDTVGIDDPDRVSRTYPHQLSGGMRQRAMIAQAIAAGPKLLIADEPTSNLDVTLQARIIELFKDLRDRMKISILLITHDLGVVQHLSDEVAVMHEGKIIERGLTADILRDPAKEYTKCLMEVIKD